MRQITRELETCFSALGDATRLRMLKLMADEELCSCEVMAALELTQPTTSHHLSILERAGLLTSKKNGKWVFYKITNAKVQNLINRGVQLGGGSKVMKKVLFVCVENAGRSQMAEAFGRAYGLEASSAGTVPAEKLNSMVVQVMKERDIALPGKPKMLTPDMIREADLVVTMGCSVQEVCPKPMVEQMEKKLVDWHIEDPKGKSIDEVKKIASQIENKVIELLKKD